MARLARVVLPGYPHHITQRGNRRQDVFFQASDYHYYLKQLKHNCDKQNVDIWAYCLMTNHVHLIVNPKEESSLAKAIGETHKHYTKMVNTRERWSGYLWQGRFASFPMDESYLLRAAAYVELNPVVAGMVKNPWDYPYSSVHAHLSGKDELDIINPNHLLDLVGDWKLYLSQSQGDKVTDLQKHTRTGRPLGAEGFVQMAEKIVSRVLSKGRPGPKKKDN
jgi:putative transposase